LKKAIFPPLNPFIHKKSKSKRAKQGFVTKTTEKDSFKQGWGLLHPHHRILDLF
jgi:hypothetical protein